jgi:iron complex outermembrane receptor protein
MRQVHFMYEQAYGVNGNHLMEFISTETKMESLQNKTNTVFINQQPIFFTVLIQANLKNFDFGMSWRGSWGNYIYNNVDSSKGSFQNILLRETDLSNGVDNILQTGFTTQDTKRYESDYYIQDAAFIRLDNVSVGYTFNQKPNASLVKVTLAAQNVVLTNYSG